MDLKRMVRDETKVMGPLFPRLHVNDTEKGGPRAPPRNKMSLYEQFSVPCQRFTSKSPYSLPLSESNGGSMVPSAFNNVQHFYADIYQEDYVNGRSFRLVSREPIPGHLAENIYPDSLKESKLNTAMGNLKRKSTSYHTPRATTHLALGATSLRSKNLSSPEKFYLMKFAEGNQSRVPIVSHSRTAPPVRNSQFSVVREKQPHPNSSMQLQTAFQKQFKETRSTDLKSRQGVVNEIEKGYKVPPIRKDTASFVLHSNKISAGASSSQSARNYYSEPLKRAWTSLNQKNITSSEDKLSRVHGSNQEFFSVEERIIPREPVLMARVASTTKGNATMIGGEPYLKLLHEDDPRSVNGVEDGGEGYRDEELGSSQIRDIDENNDVSDASMLDSVSGLTILPDDVVKVIGEKKFLKTRKAILSQQRVFAVQVFELHRLIKVQKMIFASPQLLFEGGALMNKTPQSTHPMKMLSDAHALELPPMAVKPMDDMQKLNSSAECAESKAACRPAPLNSYASKQHLEAQSRQAQPTYQTTDFKVFPWSFLPSPGSHWLVPIMSPSEGLVYKPYTGPCLPTADYSNCKPVTVPTGNDNISSVFGASDTHCQGMSILHTNPLGQTHLQHCGSPVMNRSMCGSAVEKMQDGWFPVGAIKFNTPFQSSCNIVNQKSGLMTSYVNNTDQLNESAHNTDQLSESAQGSRVSSSSETAEGNVLPLFPTAPTFEVSDTAAQTYSHKPQTEVIKVVPHNPRLATESAARIFQSIKEGRRHDS